MSKIHARQAALGIVSLGGFILLAQLSQMHSELLQRIVAHVGVFGAFVYVALLVVAVVVAPVSTGFLLPIAANTWGPFLAAILSLSGWTLGAGIAFLISRKYGLRFVGHFGIVQKLRAVEEVIPRQHMFIVVLLLRMALPVEILSYALGVFSRMRFTPYIISTVIGIAPLTFLLSYASVGSIYLQIVAGFVSASALVVGISYIVRRGVTIHTSRE